ncbi:mitochondrial 2-oxoglutarate/malate carrier protein-like [Trichoplusia ni]|uniref:Mitochondrial 2-oxoglutarate/malate carrier protein-like n=1 Tax=Trichoplusia ni TaxID=7111 RepID=A0A7E5VW21_TRINI|nr:mitochondrial 2-oxoglutarate/malate carrier protein-like [Trichoplusia ni]
MAQNDDEITYTKKRQWPEHTRLLLGGMYRILETSGSLPDHVFPMRMLFADTWYIRLFRQAARCRGCVPSFPQLSPPMLQRRILSSLKLGTYYCIYESHQKKCKERNINPLSQGVFLLTSRPVVTNVARIGTPMQIRDYRTEKKLADESSAVLALVKGVKTYMRSIATSVFNAASQLWPIDTLRASIIATTLLHPLDVIKVRLQLYPESWGVNMFRQMLRCEGLKAPYTGLTAGILRQTTYTTSRLGTYYCLYEYHKSKYGSIPSFSQKVAIGVYAGLVGAFVGCPSEIILVRMMADGPVDPYRRYRGLFDAFTKIWREEGICTLWRGALLTMSRSVVISVAQIGTYAQARDYLTERKRAKGFLLHLYTSLLSSFVTAVATLPIDTFKTRYQVMSSGSHKEIYTKFKQETGILGFWRGFTPYYLRLTVHTLVTFYLLELLYEIHHKKQKKPNTI